MTRLESLNKKCAQLSIWLKIIQYVTLQILLPLKKGNNTITKSRLGQSSDYGCPKKKLQMIKQLKY